MSTYVQAEFEPRPYQFSDGRSARSMTMTSTGTRAAVNFSPSWSCSALTMVGFVGIAVGRMAHQDLQTRSGCH